MPTQQITNPTQINPAPRQLLTADRTYYVRTDGSDSNDGLSNSINGAFRNIMQAINTVGGLDLGVHNVTIQLGTKGSWNEYVHIDGPWVGLGSVTLSGNVATPADYHINNASWIALEVANNGRLNITGIKISSVVYGLYAHSGGVINMTGRCEIGTCSNAQMYATGQGQINLLNQTYMITGGAPEHWLVTTVGLIVGVGCGIYLTGTPNFPSAFAWAEREASLEGWSSYFSGSATGPRYFVGGNAVIYVAGAGANYLPGNSAGSFANGGQYY